MIISNLHAFLFNIRNYPPEVINVQRRKAECELPRVNNFNIKQKKYGIFFCYMAPTPCKIWKGKG